MKIVFFGTSSFAADILSFLLNSGISIAAVVTRPDRPKGRSGSPVSPPVKTVALEHNPALVVYQPEKASQEDFAPTLKTYDADLFIVASYGEIVKQHLLDMPKLGCINVHASLLPKYRGAAPIQRCLIQGEKETGVTIMKMVLKMDAGDILKQATLPLDDAITAGELEQRLSALGSSLLLEVLKDLEKGPIPSVSQDHSQATLAPKLELENCEIHWRWPAKKIHDLIRGVNPQPGAWCYVFLRGQKKRLKIISSRVVVSSRQGNPGDVMIDDEGGLVIACGEQDSLQILKLQLEGKKAMSAEELIRGTPRDQLVFI